MFKNKFLKKKQTLFKNLDELYKARKIFSNGIEISLNFSFFSLAGYLLTKKRVNQTNFNP